MRRIWGLPTKGRGQLGLVMVDKLLTNGIKTTRLGLRDRGSQQSFGQPLRTTPWHD